MSGRFSHLEYGDEPRRHQAHLAETGTAIVTAEKLLAQADEAFRWGDFEPALRLYTRCLERNRKVVPAWVGQVRMLVELGENTEARMWADKALELFPSNGELLAAKAQACTRLRDRRAAYACSDGSIQAAGTSAWRWQARGEVLLAYREPTHAACFQKAMAEPDANWFDRLVIARICLFYRKAAAALDYAAQAVSAQPNAAYAWYVQGLCQQALGLSAARTSFERCLEIRADYAPARRAMKEDPTFFTRLWRRIAGR